MGSGIRKPAPINRLVLTIPRAGAKHKPTQRLPWASPYKLILQAVRALVKQITEECEANLHGRRSRMVTGVSCSILEQASLSYRIRRLALEVALGKSLLYF